MKLKNIKNLKFSVEVLMAVHNGKKFLEEQINSIINQSFKPNKISFALDNCNDTRLDIITTLMSKTSIEYSVHHVSFKNPAKTFHFLESKALKEILFHCDQDDIWNFQKIEKCLLEFEKGADLVIHNCDYIDAQGRKLNQNLWRKNNFKNKADIKYNLFTKTIAFGACMAFKNNKNILLEEHPYGFGNDNLRAILCVLFKKNIRLINLNLIGYRQHDNNVSKKDNKTKMRQSIIISLRSLIKLKYIIIPLLIDKNPILDSESLKILNSKIRHIIFRKLITNSKFNLFYKILILINFNNYNRYSNGLKSQIKDLLFI